MTDAQDSSDPANPPFASIIKLADGRLRRMQLTKGARFEASRRHKFTGRRTAFAIVILSIWIFGLALLALVYEDIDPVRIRFFVALSLILSFFVTAFSLLKSAMRHEVRSELFLKCAQDIDEICADFSRNYTRMRSRLETSYSDKAVADLYKLIEESDHDYQKILTHFNDNHSEIDHKTHFFKTYGKPKSDASFARISRFSLSHFYWKMKLVLYQGFAIIISLMLPIAALLEEGRIERWLFADGAVHHSTQSSPISR